MEGNIHSMNNLDKTDRVPEVRVMPGEYLDKALRGKVRFYSPDYSERGDVIADELLRVGYGEVIRVSFLDSQGERFHGISMGTSSKRGKIIVDEQSMRGFVILDTQKPEGFEAKCMDPEGLINFHHVYGSEDENNGTFQSLMYGTGMTLEERDDGLLVYKCNDVGINNSEFTDFVFTVERL